MEFPDRRATVSADRAAAPRWASPAVAVSPRPVGGGRSNHQPILLKLKGVSIVATAVAASAFGVLVAHHPVGATTQPATPAGALGSSSTSTAQGTVPAQGTGPVDPFFDPNPGSGSQRGGPAVFGRSGNGASPAFQSSGS